MDFWAQHKDFVLKILAGFGVFLVALIARGIVYGDELEVAKQQNRKMSGAVRKMAIADVRSIQQLEAARDKLTGNAEAIIDQIGFRGTAEELDGTLIERTLGYLRPYRDDPGSLKRAVSQARQAILDNLNSGFGQLRGTVEDELRDEASSNNIDVDDGFGFSEVTQLESGELEKYLLQLELMARVVRYCIDERVDSVEEVRIDRKGSGQAVLGANPEFLREFPIRFRFTGSQKSVVRVLKHLNRQTPAPPMRAIRMERTTTPPDHVSAEITLVAIAATLDAEHVPFYKEAEGEQ